MRYLALLFVAAFLVLNEPIKPAVAGDHAAVDGQDASCATTPASSPTVTDAVAPSSPVEHVELAYAVTQPAAEVSEGSPRAWDNIAPSALTNNLTTTPITTETQEGSRLLCHTSSISHLSNYVASTPDAYSRASREAVPRRTC